MSTSTLIRPPSRSATGGAPRPREGTAVGRLSYPELFVPKRFKEQRGKPGSGTGEPKYSCSVIAYGKFVQPMKDSVQSAMRAVIDAKYPDPESLPPRGLRGTAKKEPILKQVADYPKMWPGAPEDAIYIRASSSDMPVFVDGHVQPLSVDEAKLLFIAGCWVCIAFHAFHYAPDDTPPGIALGLDCVQFIRPGPRFGAARTAPGDVLAPINDDDPLFSDFDV
jgi:hypothetical protein